MSAITPQNIGRSDGSLKEKFPDFHIRPNSNKLLLKKHEVYHEKTEGGIILPAQGDMGNRMNKGTVEAIGEIAAKISNLKIGDVVIYDHLATYYDWSDYALLPISEVNIEEGVLVVQVFNDGTSKEYVKPIGNRVMLEPILEKEKLGFIIPDQYVQPSVKGKVLELGNGISKYCELKKNDTVIISTQSPASLFVFKSKKYIIIGEDQILCVLTDEEPKKTRKKKKNV